MRLAHGLTVGAIGAAGLVCGCVCPVTTPHTRQLTERLRDEPGDLEVLTNRAFAHAMLGNACAAEADFRRALRQTPDDPELRRSYGWALFNLGRRRAALREWRRAVALCEEPPWWEPHTLAIGHWINGDRQAALDLYNKAATDFPDRFASWQALTSYTTFWTWEEKVAVYRLYDAWSRAYRKE